MLQQLKSFSSAAGVLRMNENLAVPVLSLADSCRDGFTRELWVSGGRTIKIKIQDIHCVLTKSAGAALGVLKRDKFSGIMSPSHGLCAKNCSVLAFHPLGYPPCASIQLGRPSQFQP